MTPTSGVTGQSLKVGAEGDPQYYPPPFPRLLRGALVYNIQDPQSPKGYAIMLRGVQGSKLIRGGSVDFLSTLVDKLDGTRTHQQLSRDLEIEQEGVVQGLYLLLHAGVLADGSDWITSQTCSKSEEDESHCASRTDLDPQLDVLCEATRRYNSPQNLLDHLSGLQLSVTADTSADAVLGTIRSGIESVLTDYIERLDSADPEYVIVFDPSSNMDTVKSYYSAGVKVICISVNSQTLIVGPVLIEGLGGCPDCMIRIHQAEQSARPERARSLAHYPDLAIYLASISIVGLLGGIGDRTILRNCLTIDIDTGHSNSELSVPYECEGLCWSTVANSDIETVPVRQYEDMTQFLPASLRNPRDHQRHYEGKAGSLVLESYEEKDLFHNGGGSAPIEIEASLGLGEVLRAGVGTSYTTHGPRRFAPNGGNLGSVQICLYAIGWPSIPDGHYKYLPASNRLTSLGDPPSSLDLPDEIKGVVELHLTSAVQRLSSKYGATALKICAIDSGAAIANMESVAAAVGIHTRLILRESKDDYSSAILEHANAEMLSACLRLEKRL